MDLLKKLQYHLFSTVIVSLLIFTTYAFAQNHPLHTNGWTITADTERSALLIEYADLGVVLKDVQLRVKQDSEWQNLPDWQVTRKDEQILIHTENPSTDWTFYIRNRVLGIITSVDEGQITAIAPADRNRFPARMIDYGGRAKPVAWKGTDEIGYSFGGNQTKNHSFLPAENPEVLYLSLGQVASRNMHCLFDKNSDTMIKFHNATQMQRKDDNDLLELFIPVGSALISGVGSFNMEAIVIYSDYYTEHLGLPVYKPMNDANFRKPPVMWNSWTNYYYLVTEEEVVKNVNWIVDNFNNYGLEYIVIDDGPERGKHGEHYWINNWNQETFPHGPKWLVNYINSKGLKAGLWVVPNSYAGAVDDHPEWYLKDKDGKAIFVYNSPSLDYTNPDVLNFLTQMFTTLRDWGFEYYKFDAEFALTEYIPNVDKSKLHDPNIPPLDAYRNRLEVIRKAVGDSTFIEGCPAGTPLQGIGYFNSYFNGDDIYNSWLGMYPFFLSLNANLFLNNVTVYLMPGEGICVSPKMDIEHARTVYNPEFIRVASSRETNISSVGTTMPEARTIVTFASLSGTPYSFADRLPDLPAQRIDLLKKSLPTMPIIPMDLFSRGGYSSWDLFEEFTPETYEHDFPRIIDLKINAASGKYDVVATTNWTNKSLSREILFANKLGLDPQKSYLLFDFWNQEFLGVCKESVVLNIKPHDTHVLHIREALQRPQILGTDRHITGAYSIKSLLWDPEKQILSGSSIIIAGTQYSLFVYVPENFSFSKIKSNVKVESAEVHDSVLKINLSGQQETATWSLKFN